MKSRAGAWLCTRKPASAPTTTSKTAGANRLPAASCAPQNKAAAISPTLAASPSMLSSMLNALVKPTIHSTVTVPPRRGWVNGPNSVTRIPLAATSDGTGELDAQPDLPIEIVEIVKQAHDHDHAGQSENPDELARTVDDPTEMTLQRLGKPGPTRCEHRQQAQSRE